MERDVCMYHIKINKTTLFDTVTSDLCTCKRLINIRDKTKSQFFSVLFFSSWILYLFMALHITLCAFIWWLFYYCLLLWTNCPTWCCWLDGDRSSVQLLILGSSVKGYWLSRSRVTESRLQLSPQFWCLPSDHLLLWSNSCKVLDHCYCSSIFQWKHWMWSQSRDRN